jgi:hypothetical protein
MGHAVGLVLRQAIVLVRKALSLKSPYKQIGSIYFLWSNSNSGYDFLVIELVNSVKGCTCWYFFAEDNYQLT